MSESEGGGEQETKVGKETGTGFNGDVTGAVNMGDRVLARVAEETGRDIRAGHFVLVAHASKSGQRIVDEGNMVENQSRGKCLHCAREELIRDRPYEAAARSGGGAGGRRKGGVGAGLRKVATLREE